MTGYRCGVRMTNPISCRREAITTIVAQCRVSACCNFLFTAPSGRGGGRRDITDSDNSTEPRASLANSDSPQQSQQYLPGFVVAGTLQKWPNRYMTADNGLWRSTLISRKQFTSSPGATSNRIRSAPLQILGLLTNTALSTSSRHSALLTKIIETTQDQESTTRTSPMSCMLSNHNIDFVPLQIRHQLFEFSNRQRHIQ